MHSSPTGGGIHQLRENDDLQAKIANLTRKLQAIELKKVNEVTVVPQVPSVPMVSSMGNFQQEKGKLPSQTIQNPQVKIVLESQVQEMAPLNIARLSPLFVVEK